MTIVYFESPIGWLQIEASDWAIETVEYVDQPKVPAPAPGSPKSQALAEQCQQQLAEYFAGRRRSFDLPLHITSTTFITKAWAQLMKIPYGETMTYGQVAAAMDRPRTARAIGLACHTNPITIIVPCHRVVGSGNKMIGYASGIWRKEWLLAHEQKFKADKATV